MTNTLLISEKYVKTQSNIQDNVWGDFLTPAIREAQDIELQPIIGRPLYKKILKEVENKDVEERFKTLIEDWIQPYLLYQTIVSLIPIIGTKLGNIGTVISNDEHVQNISSSERENLEYRYRYLADHYKSELQKYLLANKDLYPELTSTCLKNLNLKSSNSLPLWTGGLRHGQRESTDCPDKADYADPDGRKAGYIEGGKTISVTKNNATTTILPSEGYDGFSSVEVEVNVPIEESKTVKITENNSTTTISASEGYDGIKDVNVEVNVPIQDKKTVSVTENNSTATIVPDEGYDGISIVDVEVNVPIQDKKTVEDNVNIPAGGSQTVVKTIDVDEGYDGMKSVDVTLNVSAPLNKIPLIDGQKLCYSKIKSNKDFVTYTPDEIFDFSNITDFENITFSTSLITNTRHGWGNDWRNMPEIKSNIGSMFIAEYKDSSLNNICFYTPKIIFGGNNTKLEGFDGRSCFPQFDGGIVFDVENTELIDTYDKSFAGVLVMYDEKNIDKYINFFKNWHNATVPIKKCNEIFKNLQSVYEAENDDNENYINFNMFKNALEFPSTNPFFSQSTVSIDVSDVVCNNKAFFNVWYFSDSDPNLIKKIKISSKFFDKKFNKYVFNLRYWHNFPTSVSNFVNILPTMENTTTLFLNRNTVNILTDEQKSSIAEKNWTIAS